MVRVLINHNWIAVPIPIADESAVIRRDAAGVMAHLLSIGVNMRCVGITFLVAIIWRLAGGRRTMRGNEPSVMRGLSLASMAIG